MDKENSSLHIREQGTKLITVIACANAAGSTLPPIVIFDGQWFIQEWSKGEVPNTLYGMLDKGWTGTYFGEIWILTHGPQRGYIWQAALLKLYHT